MTATIIWNIDDVDESTKNHFESAIQEKILSNLEIPENIQNQNIKIRIRKNTSDSTKSYSIIGEIVSQDNDYIEYFRIDSDPHFRLRTSERPFMLLRIAHR
jgi:hypothetical protein